MFIGEWCCPKEVGSNGRAWSESKSMPSSVRLSMVDGLRRPPGDSSWLCPLSGRCLSANTESGHDGWTRPRTLSTDPSPFGVAPGSTALTECAPHLIGGSNYAESAVPSLSTERERMVSEWLVECECFSMGCNVTDYGSVFIFDRHSKCA